MNTSIRQGGCLCGAVRYALSGEPLAALHCHCSDCRRATGAPFVTWAIFPQSAVTWLQGEPRRFAWAGRVRLFCGACGTALAIIPPPPATTISVTVCSLDHPESLAPALHAWTQDKLPWIHVPDESPAMAAATRRSA